MARPVLRVSPRPSLRSSRPSTAPAVGALPRSTGVTVDAVELWDDEAEAFAPSDLHPTAAWSDSRSACLSRFVSSRASCRQKTFPIAVANAVGLVFAYREEYRPRSSKRTYRMGRRRPSRARSCARARRRRFGSTAYPGCRWQGSSDGGSTRREPGGRSERRARRRRVVCVRTAVGLVSSVITKSRSTGAVLNCPTWAASCGYAGRVIFGDTRRGGARRGTHYSIACGEAERRCAEMPATGCQIVQRATRHARRARVQGADRKRDRPRPGARACRMVMIQNHTVLL